MAVQPTSETWADVEAHCRAALAEARRHIEAPGTKPEATELHRGIILALKRVLALGEPQPPLNIVSPTYGD